MSNPTLAPQPLGHRARPGAPALLVVCVAALLASASVPALAQSDALARAPAPRAAQAFDDLGTDHWRVAYLRVVRLADQGDADASRLALRMRHAAVRVFGVALQPSAAQLRRWATAVANDDWANCDAPSDETVGLLPG
jgi:hypothetical protein